MFRRSDLLFHHVLFSVSLFWLMSSLVQLALAEGSSDWGWDLPTIYESSNDQSPFQSIGISGMIHYQYALVDSGIGSKSDIDVRRFRLGPKVAFLNNFLFSSKLNLQPESDQLYRNLSTIYLTYAPSGNDKKDIYKRSFTLGKQRMPFTREHSTSAKKIKTVERSLLVNQLAPYKSTGIYFREGKNKLDYSLGLFSGDNADEFSRFQEDYLILGKLGVELSDDVYLALDYLYSTGEQSITSNIHDAYSLSLSWNEDYGLGNFSMMVDLILSDGNKEVPDAAGFVVMPSLKINEKLELVSRYQFAKSDGSNGLRLQKRYERLVTSINNAFEMGESYHAGYFGFSYFLNDNNLKLVGGIEFSTMDQGKGRDNYEGWSFMTGVRMAF